MNLPVNYESALRQVQDAGLEVMELRLDEVRMQRCKVAGERGMKGWYSAKTMKLDGGDWVVVGAFGVWHGNDNGAQKFEIPKSAPRTKEENAAIRKRIMEDKKRAAADLKRQHDKAAFEAVKEWRSCATEGASGYLERKQVKPFGVRFKDGAVVVPMMDTDGKIHGLQFILDKENEKHRPKIKQMEGSDKRFWPNGMAMAGHFHMIGEPGSANTMLVTEGYATGASLHMASGMPVAVVFNANNVLPALLNLQKHYRRTRFIICADDDYLCRCGAIVEGSDPVRRCSHQVLVEENPDAHPTKRSLVPCSHCGKPHKKINTGVSVAVKACMTVDAAYWIVPQFTTRLDAKSGNPRKLTDFNDLHVEESLQAVEAQVKAAIESKIPAAGNAGEAESARGPRSQGGGEDGYGLGLITVDDVADQYDLIYGVEGAMFDRVRLKLVPKSCVLDRVPGRAWEDIKRHHALRRVDIDNVGFDPTGDDKNVICNMWGGWPTVADDRGSCEKQLELLEYLCSGEKHGREIVKWVLSWMAYIVQNPGAKMKTAIVMHGPTRVGKNLLFEESFAKIFGPYAFTIGQSDLESQFNEWASRKLFIIANEVVARQEIFHQKGKMRGLITDPTININPKTKIKYSERNHINLVFFSNELQPVVPDPDDERFLVIWTPKRLEKSFYLDVVKEIRNGGSEALHHFLLNYDVGDFHVSTPPLMTKAKETLVELSKDSVQRFIEEWQRGMTDFPYCACLKADLYEAYMRWCKQEGERYPRTHIQFSTAAGKLDGIEATTKPIYEGLEKALVKSPTSAALERKIVRMYMVDSGDDLPADVMEARTRSIVEFRQALRGQSDEL